MGKGKFLIIDDITIYITVPDTSTLISMYALLHNVYSAAVLRISAEAVPYDPRVMYKNERFEVFTGVIMKNAVFWDVTPRGYCMNRWFGGTYRLHHQGDNR
jgi:hypothetical protein